jgi:predicted component of type VI protein secretion system
VSIPFFVVGGERIRRLCRPARWVVNVEGGQLCGGVEGKPVWRQLTALLALTKPLDVPVGDQTDGESEEGLVNVVASFPADS